MRDAKGNRRRMRVRRLPQTTDKGRKRKNANRNNEINWHF